MATQRQIRAATQRALAQPVEDSDSFGKWIVRGIAIGIGLLIVEIPLALIVMWWLNHQLSKIGF
ncbi:MAG: hypothetical protein OXL37_01570 [Chloroflexota bacterium]|nr:hypothetical protein [Chloroflexota bacterium]MDE2961293.1 hypothetical protein [Chloroflexota bacterium]